VTGVIGRVNGAREVARRGAERARAAVRGWGVLPARTRRRFLLVGLLPVIVASLAFSGFSPTDLQVYRFGALALAAGHDIYGPLPVPRGSNPLPFIYPPFAAVAFLPLALPSLPLAALAMDALSAGSLAMTLHLVIRRIWTTASRRVACGFAVALSLVCVALEPVRETFSFGQVNLVLMALVAVDCLNDRPRWRRGILVGIAVAVKVTPAVFIMFFLLRKDFRAARNSVLSGAVVCGLCWLIAPDATRRYFLGGELTGASGLSGSPYATNQTIAGALNRLALPPVWHQTLWLVLSVATLVVGVIAIRRADRLMALILTALTGLVLSPISWSHHWVWIAPALVLLGGRALRAANPAALGGVLLVGVIFIVAPHSHLPATHGRELTWTPWEHVIGDSYLLLGLAFLAWNAFRPLVRQRCADARLVDAEPTAPSAG
jgi:alpha-1,2-mannosyltransferase